MFSRTGPFCIPEVLICLPFVESEQPPAAALDATQGGEPAADVLLDSSWTMPENMSTVPENLFSQYVAQSADEFLLQCSDTAFLDHIVWDLG